MIRYGAQVICFSFTLIMAMDCYYAADEVRELWQEYENNSTPEAKFVKDLDKVCTIKYCTEITLIYVFNPTSLGPFVYITCIFIAMS